jgi:hypothetical protein
MNIFQYHVNVCSFKDKIQSFRFLIGLYFLYYISVWFDETIITWISMIILFIWVPLYDSNKDKIESFMINLNKRLHDTYDSVKAKIPKFEDVTKKKSD